MADFETPRLEELDSQPEAQRLLLSFLKEPSTRSFLWLGPQGSGKRTHAVSFVRNLFCKEGTGCPGCPACKQVLSKTHPDLFWVQRDHFWTEVSEDIKKQGIVVSTAKRLAEKLNQAAFSAPFKVAVIPDADQLNIEAQNVLLKTLEEPPADTILILLAEKAGDFLPTVLSRCRIIRFQALAVAKVEKILVDIHGWKGPEAKKAALASNGNLTEALRMADPQWVAFWEKVCSEMDGALGGGDGLWLALGSEYDGWEPDWLPDTEMTATQRKGMVLGAVFQVYSNLWSRRMRGDAEIPRALATLPPDQVLRCLQKHRDILEQNLGAKMVLDHLFLELREGLKKGSLENPSFMELSTQI
ncbi:MAG TPA: hypothetical protein VHE12_06230 [bacterium]|nr:hypothetical protein [bacterium]